MSCACVQALRNLAEAVAETEVNALRRFELAHARQLEADHQVSGCRKSIAPAVAARTLDPELRRKNARQEVRAALSRRGTCATPPLALKTVACVPPLRRAALLLPAAAGGQGKMEFRTPWQFRHENSAIDWLGAGRQGSGEPLGTGNQHRGVALDRHLRGDHANHGRDVLHPGYRPFK